jgi:hypothetical protein
MYKRVSIALENPKVSALLRLATLLLLSALAWFKMDSLEFSSIWIDSTLFLSLTLVALLSFINLLAEAGKYRALFGMKFIDLRESLRSVIAGMSIGIWTPNRVGEFVGRMRYAPRGQRKKAVGASFAGSLLQGAVTIAFGCLGIFVFDFRLQFGFDITPLLVGVLVLIIFLFYGFHRGPLAELNKKHLNPRRNQWLSASTLAIVRYLIFSSQFVLLLFSFGFTGSVSDAFGGVFILYAIQSYIPGSLLSELGVREVLSVLIFSSYFDSSLGAPLAAFCLWALNIGLPIGTWSLYSGLKKIEG